MFARAALSGALLAALARAQPRSIVDFGAVAGVDTHAAALANGAALAQALAAANSSAPGARAALVPAGKVYAFLPGQSSYDNFVVVTLLIEGTLNCSTADTQHR